MPRLQQAVKDLLSDCELLCNLTADEVISLGCCQQAALMAEPWGPSCQHSHVSIPSLAKAISIRVRILD
jgi:hypothetical protein